LRCSDECKVSTCTGSRVEVTHVRSTLWLDAHLDVGLHLELALQAELEVVLVELHPDALLDACLLRREDEVVQLRLVEARQLVDCRHTGAALVHARALVPSRSTVASNRVTFLLHLRLALLDATRPRLVVRRWLRRSASDITSTRTCLPSLLLAIQLAVELARHVLVEMAHDLVLSRRVCQRIDGRIEPRRRALLLRDGLSFALAVRRSGGAVLLRVGVFLVGGRIIESVFCVHGVEVIIVIRILHLGTLAPLETRRLLRQLGAHEGRRLRLLLEPDGAEVLDAQVGRRRARELLQTRAQRLVGDLDDLHDLGDGATEVVHAGSEQQARATDAGWPTALDQPVLLEALDQACRIGSHLARGVSEVEHRGEARDVDAGIHHRHLLLEAETAHQA
jgi:hypothetical protein